MVTTEKKPRKSVGKQDLEAVVKRYEDLYSQLTRFTSSIADLESEIEKARESVAEAKARYEDEKGKLYELENSRDGAKHSLYRFLNPKNMEVFPLLDTMEPADEEKHGKNSDEWRKDPIGALKLSLPSLQALMECDIVMVGQLQDRVMADREWWKQIPNLNAGSASAICDRLNDFIFERAQ